MSTNKKKPGAPAAPAAGKTVEAAGPAPKPIIFLEFALAAHPTHTSAPQAAAGGKQDISARSRPGTDSKQSDHSRRQSAVSKDGLASNDDIPDDGSNPRYRFEFELAADVLPRTCENFKQFAAGTATIGDKKNARVVGYKGTRVVRVAPWFVQCGDVLHREDGKGQESIYGPTFEDEHLGAVPHKFGVLSMANSGPNTNGCQFVIVASHDTQEYAHMDHRYQAFAVLLGGPEAEEKLTEFHEAVLAVAAPNGSVPHGTFSIVSCGIAEPRPTPQPAHA